MGVLHSLRLRFCGALPQKIVNTARARSLARNLDAGLLRDFLDHYLTYVIRWDVASLVAGGKYAKRWWFPLRSLLAIIRKYYGSKERAGWLDFSGALVPEPANDIDLGAMIGDFPDIVLPQFEVGQDILALLATGGMYEGVAGVRMQPGDVVIDAGANLGLFSAVALSRGCRVYAFEPAGEVVQSSLAKMAEINPELQVIEAALADAEGETVFCSQAEVISVGRLDAVRVQAGDALAENFKDLPARRVVKLTTLDEFVKQNQIDKIDFIKADIEGAERLLLRGAAGVLRLMAPRLSICTYHLQDDPVVLRELILSANPKYRITMTPTKIYAWVP